MSLSVMPNTTPAIPSSIVTEEMVVGMENPHSRTLEVIQVGRIIDGRAYYHWQTGTLARDDGSFVLAEARLYELTPALKAKARRYRAARLARMARPMNVVPPTPAGMCHSRWLAMCNCD